MMREQGLKKILEWHNNLICLQGDIHWAKLKYTPFYGEKGGVFQFGPVYLSTVPASSVETKPILD